MLWFSAVGPDASDALNSHNSCVIGRAEGDALFSSQTQCGCALTVLFLAT